MEPVDGSLAPLELPTLDARLGAARESIKRSRLAFVVTTILSLTVLITLYNAYVSWYRGFALQDAFAENEVTRTAQITLLQEWVRNHTIAIQPLGVRAGVSDIAFLASTSLFISTLWFFFCVRRENHVVALLLADTEQKTKDILSLVFHGVASHMIFLDATGSDEPIDNLQPPLPGKKRLPFVRGSIKLLYFLPGLTIAACVLFDLLSIFYLRAPFREPHSPLSTHLRASDITWIIIIEGLAVILGTLNWTMSARVVAFQNATEKVIRDYHGLLSDMPNQPLAADTSRATRR